MLPDVASFQLCLTVLCPALLHSAIQTVIMSSCGGRLLRGIWSNFSTIWSRGKSPPGGVESGASRLSPLDGLRAIAVLSVFFDHIGGEMRSPSTSAFQSSKWYMVIASNGDLGVDIFFVLSGFLIAHVLIAFARKRARLDERAAKADQTGMTVQHDDMRMPLVDSSVYVDVQSPMPSPPAPTDTPPCSPRLAWNDVGTFLVRRFFRLWPTSTAAILILLFRLGVDPRGGGINTNCRDNVWTKVFYLDVYVDKPSCAGLGQWWSISVEWQFYLISPLVICLWLKRPRWGHFACVFLVLTHIGSVFAAALYSDVSMSKLSADDDWWSKWVYQMVWTRCAPYGMGMAAGLAWADLTDRLAREGRTIEDYRQRAATYGTQPLLVLLSFLLILCGLFLKTGENTFVTMVDLDHGGGEMIDRERFWLVMQRPMFALGVTTILWCSLTQPSASLLPRFLSSRPLYPLAVLSFSAYVLSFVSIRSARAWVLPSTSAGEAWEADTFWKYSLLWAVQAVWMVFCAIPLHVFVEKPSMKLRW